MKKFFLIAMMMAFGFWANAQNHWTPIEYPFTMTLTGVVVIDGVEQMETSLEIGVFCGNECRGSEMLSADYYSIFGHYFVMLSIYGNSGDLLSFRLYSHSTNTELDLNCSNALAFATDGQIGNPTNPYVFDFFSAVTTHTIAATANPTEGGTVSGAGDYDHGTNCTLTATANTGYTFDNWTENGTVVSTTETYSFTVTGDRNLVANFTDTPVYYTIAATANPTEGGTITGTGIHLQGTECTLTATANEGYQFTGWMENGNTVYSDPEYTFTVNGNRTLMATFNEVPAGYHWNFDPTAYPTTMSFMAIVNIDDEEQFTTDLEIGAFCGDECRGREMLSDNYYAAFNHYYVFLNVYGNSGDQITFRLYDHGLEEEPDVNCSNTASFVINGMVGDPGTPYEFNFMTRVYYTVTASANIANAGTITGTGTYENGTDCTLTATANEGYTFLNWTKNGEVVSTNAQYTFTVTESAHYVANYTLLETFTITAESNPEGAGNITGAGSYLQGSECSLTVVPSSIGYTFINWTMDGNIASTEPTHTFTVTSDAHYIANFSVNAFTITATADPSEAGTVSGGGSYNWGDTCNLTATPASGYDFVNWTENGVAVSSNPNLSFTVNGPRNLVANFAEAAPSEYHWNVGSTYSSTITFTGIIQIDGVEQATTDLEIGAFCNGECRGREKLNDEYYTIFNHYYVFLNVGGNDGDLLTFRLYDHGTETELDLFCSNTITYVTNGSYGDPGTPYVFDFVTAIVAHTITATANPTEGGTVSGTGEYDHGTTCTLTATANYGFALDNWTENGQVVSTEVEYTFTVIGDRNLVANFTSNLADYDITATANPAEGGTISGAGTYQQGSPCTLTATANNGFTFSNWTENGTTVSSSAEYSFIVNGNRNLVANFNEVPAGYHWNFDPTAYPTTMSFMAIVNIDDEEQFTTDLEVGAFCGDECRGRERLNDNYYTIFGHYYMFLYTNGNNGDQFTFRIYDHSLGQELDVNCTSTATFVANGNLGEVDAPYVFNFYNIVYHNVTATASPAEGGSVAGGGRYEEGTDCTLTATPNEGYNFVNWTLGGEVVSNSPTYSFTVTEAADYVANFELKTYEIVVTSHPAGGGILTGGGIYHHFDTCTLTATVNDQFIFSNWSKDDEVLTTDTVYSFMVTEAAEFVANFERITITQTTSIATGWNWFSTYIEQDLEDINGMQMLEESLGTIGEKIQSQTQFTQYLPSMNMWVGLLNSINNESSYQIKANASGEISMTGPVAHPSMHPITLNANWNWIGYPCTDTLSVAEAFANLTPNNGDQVKSASSFTIYHGALHMWIGGLQNITPGMGLLYKNTGGQVSFTYPDPDSPRGGSAWAADLDDNDNHWQADAHAYPNNMTVIAVVELDGMELDAEHYEIAAFANGECRGSAKLMYVEPLNRHMAFLTIHGEDAIELCFSLYDSQSGTERHDADNLVTYANNATLGEIDEPFVVSFRGLTGVDEFDSNLHVFPNPVARGEAVNLGMANSNGNVQVEVVNAMGAVVSMETLTKVASIAAPKVPGVYTLRITADGKDTCHRKLIVQ